MYKIKRKHHIKKYTPLKCRYKTTKSINDITITELYKVFRNFPELEQKYLNLMKLPITGREHIQIPFDLFEHHQYTCLDFSPYANEQISRSVCQKCEHITFSTSSDSIVTFMNQPSNMMQYRTFYYGFRKNINLLKLLPSQPTIFQIFYLVYSYNTEILPLLYSDGNKLHMHIIFESQSNHLPCEIIKNIVAAATGYSITLNIIHENLTLSVTCKTIQRHMIKIDVDLLLRKFEEIEIPGNVTEKYDTYKDKFELLM